MRDSTIFGWTMRTGQGGRTVTTAIRGKRGYHPLSGRHRRRADVPLREGRANPLEAPPTSCVNGEDFPCRGQRSTYGAGILQLGSTPTLGVISACREMDVRSPSPSAREKKPSPNLIEADSETADLDSLQY